MYEEGVKEYFVAKRMASKRLLGQAGNKLRFRPQDLPSNGEIRDALLLHADLVEGEERTERLFAMRVVALRVMRQLAPFQPAIIGSVATGHVRRGSDIDLHVFTESPEELEIFLEDLGWDYQSEEVTIRKNGTFQDYLHYYIEDDFPIELTVYEPREKRIQQRSSTDGKPIKRLSADALEERLLTEHTEAWLDYLAGNHGGGHQKLFE
ncbi:MAG: nucleotidyltransferase domain-containing protein [Myxococcales bacterium]|nr:nucleotidyltransferase domain-containing protein [Myxococcales bacterium]